MEGYSAFCQQVSESMKTLVQGGGRFKDLWTCRQESLTDCDKIKLNGGKNDMQGQ